MGAHVELHQFHIVGVELTGGGVTVGVSEDGLKVGYQLQPKEVPDCQSSSCVGAIHQFSWQAFLDAAFVEGHFEDWTHDIVSLRMGEGGGNQGVF